MSLVPQSRRVPSPSCRNVSLDHRWRSLDRRRRGMWLSHLISHSPTHVQRMAAAPGPQRSVRSALAAGRAVRKTVDATQRARFLTVRRAEQHRARFSSPFRRAHTACASTLSAHALLLSVVEAENCFTLAVFHLHTSPWQHASRSPYASSPPPSRPTPRPRRVSACFCVCAVRRWPSMVAC
jgi:hypothetical protein